MAAESRISSLDGLRGLAASAVVFSHLDQFFHTDNRWLSLNVGDEAVAIFFALSGFLMASLYGSRSFNAADYLVHRFARIYPVYLVAVLWVVMLSAVPNLDYFEPITGATQIVRHIFLIGSSGVFWSIPPEIQFYIFFLAIWLWFTDPTKYQWIAVILVAFLAVDAYLGFPGPGILLTSKIPYFLFGTIAGKLFTMFEKRPDGITTGIACLILLVLFFLSRGLYPTQTPFWGLTSAFIGAVIVYLAACENRFSSAVLGSKPLVFAGKISFSLYLFHVPVIFLMMKLVGPLVPTPLAIAISVGMAYLFASMTNLVIEETSRRFLVGLWRRRRSAEPAIYPAPEAAR